ncbi:glycoside hydrolase family 2 protein [Leptonema illini]|uniref:glycoside hydrolase family 2 protein n=1 Tax=Leptonema illini TaxID=183 RepID=UPI0003016D2C|nr:sugar-binding domain-containing protein [Leptonema illini]
MVRDSSFDRQEGTTLRTPWADAIDPDNVLAEYPRPQMRRDSYLNLNGYWSYSINESETCSSYEGKILVPFSPESVLSGVQRSVRPGEYLHYHRKITLPHGFMKDRLVIHFGAVDQTATLFINDREVGTHTGGYTPFRFDITDFLTGDEIDIRLVVTDISDTGCHQTGKQRIERGGIWYTPQSGIWQTVWMESLPSTHIRDLRLTPLYHEQALKIEVDRTGTGVVSVEARLNGIVQGTARTDGDTIVLPLKELHAWTPETPHLYDLTVQCGDDVIQSYFGMRHFEMRKDAKGRTQFYLNGNPYFQTGVLDQGYYPDGLLTPPSDEAMIYDIELMKSMGFNMLRKHIKIEPLRGTIIATDWACLSGRIWLAEASARTSSFMEFSPSPVFI